MDNADFLLFVHAPQGWIAFHHVEVLIPAAKESLALLDLMDQIAISAGHKQDVVAILSP